MESLSTRGLIACIGAATIESEALDVLLADPARFDDRQADALGNYRLDLSIGLSELTEEYERRQVEDEALRPIEDYVETCRRDCVTASAPTAARKAG